MPNNPSELKASGLKATLPRLKILDIFQTAEVRHLSAEDVYKMSVSYTHLTLPTSDLV